jgi:hypothetical protein
VFSCILQVLEENSSNSKIRMKSENSLLETYNFKLILNLRKKKLVKCYFLKESRMSMFLYFNYKFLLKYQITAKLAALES